MMKRMRWPALLLGAALAPLPACTGQNATENKLHTAPMADAAETPSGARADQRPRYVEGKDYQVLQRVRIIDPQGFGQPVEAASFLLPKGWKLDGGVRWLVGHPCVNECVAVRYTAASPDGRMVLDGFPVRSWRWIDEPTMLQGMQASQQGYGRACDVMPPYDASQFIQQLVLPEIGQPQVVAMARADEIARGMEEQARQSQAAVMAAGVNNVAFRPSAVKAKLRWSDGTEGILLCSVDQTIAYMPNMLSGGTMSSYQCQSNLRVLLRYPAGQEAEAERILSTALSSTRVNPGWVQAVQQVFTNIGNVERAEAAKRAGIMREAQQYTSDLQRRTWEEGQASRDRINTAWGQTIRGVEEWKDPNGGTIELSAGYNEAWSHPNGTYILSNDPNFDPSVVFQEDWKRMAKPR